MSNENRKGKAIKLDFPIQVEGKKITELNMRRASLGDQIAAEHDSKTDMERETRLFANLCGLSPDDFHQLDLKDYKKVQETFKGFLK